jgi:hypothetical protein
MQQMQPVLGMFMHAMQSMMAGGGQPSNPMMRIMQSQNCNGLVSPQTGYPEQLSLPGNEQPAITNRGSVAGYPAGATTLEVYAPNRDAQYQQPGQQHGSSTDGQQPQCQLPWSFAEKQPQSPSNEDLALRGLRPQTKAIVPSDVAAASVLEMEAQHKAVIDAANSNPDSIERKTQKRALAKAVTDAKKARRGGIPTAVRPPPGDKSAASATATKVMKRPAMAGASAARPSMPRPGGSSHYLGGKVTQSASNGGWRVWPEIGVVAKERTVKFNGDRAKSFAAALDLIESGF